MKTKEKLVIFDTTLRDGEQSPGASMTKDEKLRIATVLEKMNVDVIEAGFAVSSQGDFDAVMQRVGDNPYVLQKDIEGVAPIDMPDRGSLKYPKPVN